MRHRDRAPTPLNFKFYVRAITLGQFFKSARGSSYDMDDHTSYLIELKDLKFLKKDDITEQKNEDDEESIEDTEFLEKLSSEISSEKYALARLSGYVLYKTIKKDSCKCDECNKYFISSPEIEQTRNALIYHTEYKPGALTRPSEDANEVFEMAELIFRCNRKKLCKKPKMGERMTQLILENLPTKFGNLPKCHLKLIFKRFVKIRFHFWTNFENSIAKREQKFRIIGETNASQSMKGHSLSHSLS